MATEHTQAFHTRIRDIVFDAIDQLNERRSPQERLARALDTRLAGDGGALDSLAFVNLIVGLEQRVEEQLGVSVNFFANEELDPSAGPFRTVQTLIDYLETLVAPHLDSERV